MSIAGVFVGFSTKNQRKSRFQDAYAGCFFIEVTLNNEYMLYYCALNNERCLKAHFNKILCF